MTTSPRVFRLAALPALLITIVCGGCAPTHDDFLHDAAATCGNPTLLFPDERTFETRATTPDINKNYDCVQGYLRGDPEYQAEMAGKDRDAGYVDALRRIDLAHGAGQISADEAKAESLQAYKRYQQVMGQ